MFLYQQTLVRFIAFVVNMVWYSIGVRSFKTVRFVIEPQGIDIQIFPVGILSHTNGWCCDLRHTEQIPVKFESAFHHFHSRKCIWVCCLPKLQPFCPRRDELIRIGKCVSRYLTSYLATDDELYTDYNRQPGCQDCNDTKRKQHQHITMTSYWVR